MIKFDLCALIFFPTNYYIYYSFIHIHIIGYQRLLLCE